MAERIDKMPLTSRRALVAAVTAVAVAVTVVTLVFMGLLALTSSVG